MTDSTRDPSASRQRDREHGPLRIALERLISDGTITKDQAKAVQDAVREERQKRKG